MKPAIKQDESVTQLGYVGFGVSSMSAWREFSEDILGLRQSDSDDDGTQYYRLDEYHHRILLIPGDEDDIVLTGFEVRDEAALNEVAMRLRAQGLDVQRGTDDEVLKRKVLGLYKYKDPDGIASEIYFGPFLSREPFVSPRVTSAFKASELGLGHIVRAVDDPVSYLRYLVDGLGARISDYIVLGGGPEEATATFTHVNPRHHTIAIVPASAVRNRTPFKRLLHFMVEVESLDDVGSARDLMVKHGIACGQIGKHPNDRMISVYCRTPSGFDVEYGTAGRLILKEEEWQIAHYRHVSTWGHGPIRVPSKSDNT